MIGMVTRIFSALGDLPPVTEVAGTPRLQLAGALPSAETPGQPDPRADTECLGMHAADRSSWSQAA